MKVCLYARVSTNDQSCTLQLAELRRYAAARGLDVEEEFVDTGVSGTKSSRPARDRLMESARLRKFDLVLVWKMDRWGRSVVDTMDTIRELTCAGVNFLAVSQNLGTEDSNPMSRCMMVLMAAFAEMERELIHERVLAGIARAKKVGTKTGKPIGRPRRVFRRDQAEAMRSSGKSWAQIGIVLGVPAGTVREGLRKPSPETAAVSA